MKKNYFIIPLIVILTAFFGSRLTSGGMGWYKTISLPSWTPPGGFIGAAWTIIFILTAISVLIFWNSKLREEHFRWVTALLTVNVFLNIFWSFLFFSRHFIGWAAIDAFLLGISVVALIILLRQVSKIAAGLLIPYALWTAFATYLNCVIWILNQ